MKKEMETPNALEAAQIESWLASEPEVVKVVRAYDGKRPGPSLVKAFEKILVSAEVKKEKLQMLAGFPPEEGVSFLIYKACRNEGRTEPELCFPYLSIPAFSMSWDRHYFSSDGKILAESWLSAIGERKEELTARLEALQKEKPCRKFVMMTADPRYMEGLSGTAYLAHPYGGLEENAADARRIQRKLMEAFPKLSVLNAIENAKGLGGLPSWSEWAILGSDYRLLRSMDLVVFSGNWRESRGCRAEYAKAREYHKPVFEVIQDKDILTFRSL